MGKLLTLASVILFSLAAFVAYPATVLTLLMVGLALFAAGHLV